MFLYPFLALNDRNSFKHELTLLEKVRHPNLIQFVGAVTQNFPLMIVAEYHSKVSILLLLLPPVFTDICTTKTQCFLSVVLTVLILYFRVT
jgi:serine/threonine protein kinase